MTDKTIVNGREVGGDNFYLKYLRSSKYKLDYYLNMFDPNDYYIFKSTRHQMLVSVEDMKVFKYSGYIFFKKELYDVNNILHWIEFIKTLGGIQYLSRPFPPFRPEDKIEIKK